MLQICWWEYTELIEHLRSRPDIWETDGVIWVRRSASDEPALVLQFLPPEENGPYRMYTVAPTPLSWSQEDVDEYLSKLIYHWTSYCFRIEAERLLASELKLDPSTAMMMAIILQRTQVEPSEDPEKASRAQQQVLWEDVPAYIKSCGIMAQSLANLTGSVAISKHAGQLRVQLHIVNPYPANGPHSFLLTGFVHPHGYRIDQFIRLMDVRKQDNLRTEDLDSQISLPETTLNTQDEEIASKALPHMYEGEKNGEMDTDTSDSDVDSTSRVGGDEAGKGESR